MIRWKSEFLFLAAHAPGKEVASLFAPGLAIFDLAEVAGKHNLER